MEENKISSEAAEAQDTVLKTEDTPEKKEKKSSLKNAVHELEEKLAALSKELEEKDDRFLRMAAEYDNFRRRSREEKDATYEVAKADTVAEFLPIIDNLERAALYDDDSKVKEGLVMIAKSVESVLQKLGIESVGAAGEKFDPNLHNAVMHDEDDSERENEITEVFQKGYKKGNRIIRFAMVKTVN